MKKFPVFFGLLLLSVGLSGCTVQHTEPGLFTWVLVLLGGITAIFGILRAASILQYNRRQRQRGKKVYGRDQGTLTAIVFVTAGIFLAIAYLTCYKLSR